MASDILGNTWNISQQGEDIVTENKTIKDKSTILKNALNSDLKEIGSPILAKILNKNNVSQVVLQIQKIRNVSAPKANENSHVAPRMLKFTLTDGDTYIQAIETSPIPSINPDKTPPGSKLLIHSAKICSGYLLVDSTNCSLLGGRVPALYDKWELAKSVQYHNRQNTSSDGPPAWVNFGCKIQSDIQDKQFKSLDSKNQEAKENSKFDMQRQDAIAEATSGAVKKVFGGGAKQHQQTPAPPIHKKSNDFHNNRERKNYKNKPTTNTKEVEEKPLKPSERVSLFDFLENKLPANENIVEPPKPMVISYNPSNQQNNRSRNYSAKPTNRFENNQNRARRENKPQTTQKIEETNDVTDLSNSLGKISLNSQFASRSLRQHLNLGPQKKSELENPNITDPHSCNWRVGDDCMAKYWEDGRYYNANITAITDRTCVVKFKGYGNIEEVLKQDCLPLTGNNEGPKRTHTGPMEFRRNPRVYRRQ